MFYCEFIEIFKDIYFTVHRRTTASEIQPTQIQISVKAENQTREDGI